MPHLCKHIIAAVLLAGGVLLAGTSFVDAHGKPESCSDLKHDRQSTSEGQCAYWCSIVGHDHWELYDNGNCACCDSTSRCDDD